MAEDCVFCRIAKGEIPATRLFENESVLGFLDISPASKGHALVITKKHYATLLDAPPGELGAAIEAVQKIAAATMASVPGIEGFNVLQSNSRAAGQVIPHVHFHIIPRYKDDGVHFSWQHGKPEAEELEKYAALVKKKMK